jgi:cell division protein FtsW (lipid II flippase)
MAVLLLALPSLLGFSVMFFGGAPPQRWLTHLLALALGMAAFGIVSEASRRVRETWTFASVFLVALVAATLADAGIEGVYRWQRLGPLQLHPSALLSPCILVIAVVLGPKRPRLAALALVTTQLVHLLQPDAGQATAFGVAGLIVLWPRGTLGRLAGVALLGCAALTWLRFDPLPPAPYVEDIVHRAFELSPAIGVLSSASLAVFALTPLASARAQAGSQLPRRALTAYFAGTALVPVFGEFPVPLLGYGPSPLVGAFLGLSLLRVAERRMSKGSPSSLSSSQDAGRPSTRATRWTSSTDASISSLRTETLSTLQPSGMPR